MFSLKRQLSRGLLINLLVMLLLLSVVLGVMLPGLVKEQVVTRLQHDAESLISVLQRGPDGDWQIDPQAMSTIYRRVRSGHYYLVLANDQVLRSRSLFDHEPDLARIRVAPEQSYPMPGPGDEDWLVWQQQVAKQGDAMILWVAEDIAPVYRDIYRLYAIALVIMIAFMLVSVGVQQRILNRAFRVFDRLRANISRIREQGSDLTSDAMPREIQPLVTEIGLLVEQLHQRTRRTRNAISNLSHELKKPLQLLAIEQDTERGTSAGAEAVAHIRAIIERELRRARLAGPDRISGRFHLGEELPYLVEIMARIYPRVRIDTAGIGAIPGMPFDRDDMLELLGNLLDNACKFAQQQVRLTAVLDQRNLRIDFEDDGPGVSAEQLESIATRGFRVDERVEGHGLGLSICNDIVAGFGGELSFQRSELGGLRARVKLPLPITGEEEEVSA